MFLGDLISFFNDFLTKRKQRVVLNGQHSSGTDIKAGFPQGSIPGPLFFLLLINDLTENLNSNHKFQGDGTSLFSKLIMYPSRTLYE